MLETETTGLFNQHRKIVKLLFSDLLSETMFLKRGELEYCNIYSWSSYGNFVQKIFFKKMNDRRIFEQQKNETGISENKSMHLFCQLKGV